MMRGDSNFASLFSGKESTDLNSLRNDPFDKVFQQEPPRISVSWEKDETLRAQLRQLTPSSVWASVEEDLCRFASRVTTEIAELGQKAEKTPPYLEHHNGWGQRIDHIETSAAWKRLKDVSAEEGMVAVAFDRGERRECARVYWAMKVLLFNPYSGMYSCPLAMTDGAARALELLEDGAVMREARAYERLTSRDPSKFWTSGQWMTERAGGSDVSGGTETVAVPIGGLPYSHRDSLSFPVGGVNHGKGKGEDGGRGPFWTHRLFGVKWFTSASDSQMALTLARETGDAGAAGLSLFYVELRRQNGGKGPLEGISVENLKDKMGTRPLPTAEMRLRGLLARRLAAPGRGVAAIAAMFNVTRVHNALSACACMKALINMASTYAEKRTAFGRLLIDHRLHAEVLADLKAQESAATFAFLRTCLFMGSAEVPMQGAEGFREAPLLLRLLTPVLKLWTGKLAITVCQEALECFGGQGYIETTGLPSFFRDACVLPLWEGTTTVLSLDVLRVLRGREGGAALEVFCKDVRESVRLEAKRKVCGKDLLLCLFGEAVLTALRGVEIVALRFAALQRSNTAETAALEAGARELAFGIARVFAASCLLRHAQFVRENPALCGDAVGAGELCRRFVRLEVVNATEALSEAEKGERIAGAAAELFQRRSFNSRFHTSLQHARLVARM
uniref:Acyl-CoA dehydrogenase/oxidase C-terminal domain-containing protein n=1 Tax=Chromera velia CCMP2878 TaxID=1169474 RepID=A0A0G4GB48_9ALVE|eukprot:Cvel_4430.t1-p1 / transcript=Cvel_4430.t1 / gene=Cvel_4430 / organism=Chromera_velia_CCMP2878 / gene_product=Putative acyl-CoA dehydrogenase AidB, putative / transcript_product=Putative acyl-CoA dehydrogenase AidB, putative / location=Cvel_scaffold193:18369-22819(-) / protein_length=675 / sequence_SO=supercontig / SO=protein_coding / is_pseudo=false